MFQTVPMEEVCLTFNARIDMAAKRHKKHKNKILHLIISIGYEIAIR